MASAHAQGGGAASSGPNSELAFAQRKLEENYGKVCRRLEPWRETLEVGQEVLVWKRPVPAVLLYVAVHWLFFYFATNNDSFLCRLSSLLFWVLVGDAIWRAATEGGQEGGPNNSRYGTGGARRWLRRRKTTNIMSFERALLLTHEERDCQQSVPFEVVCLTVAQLWMWLDNLWLALRHWSTHDPLMFSVSLAVPGLILALVGKYIPTHPLLYILVMGVIVWPYIRYHNLLQKSADLFSTHFPLLIQRAEAGWQFVKTLLASQSDDGLNEFSLGRGNGDGADARDLLDDEVARVIALPGEESGEEGGRGRGEGKSDEVRRRRPGGGQRSVRRADPGMSVLQDSVLGMTADAFQDVEDSLASFGPGTGDFPSISHFDQSLSLPPETEGQTLPSAPHLDTIQEAEDDMYALDESVEFGDVMDGQTGLRYRSTSQHSTSQLEPQPHPRVHSTASAPTTSSSSSYYTSEEVEVGHRTPPPPYHEVVEPEEETASSYRFKYQSTLAEELRYRETGPKGSSTPLLTDSSR